MGIVVQHTKKHASGRVEYRRAYPPKLLKFIPGKEACRWAEHKVSLGQEGDPGFFGRYSDAADAFAKIVAQAQRKASGAFDRLDAPHVAYLAELFRAQWLAKDEEQRWEGSDDWADRVSAGWAWHLDEFRRWSAEGDADAVVDHWSADAVALMQSAGFLADPADRAGLEKLCAAMNAVAIGLSDTIAARLRGEQVPTPPFPQAPSRHGVTQADIRVPLLATFDAYAAEAGISEGVRAEWRSSLTKFIGFLTHDDAAKITADDVLRWKDFTLSQPLRNGQRRTARTVNNKYLGPLRTTLRWAVDQRKLSTNVAEGVKVRLPKTVKLRERDFTQDEATRILAASLVPASPRMASGHRLARRWIPWLCAYTGARVNEMSQLRGQDVRQFEGIWCVNITPDAGTVKTQEARLVPLHPHLIEQGFLEIVDAQGDGPLFYHPSDRRSEGPENRHFKKVGERLAAWVRNDVGISDPGISPNHSWRHMFKTRAIAAGIEERVHDAITGHAASTVGRSYGSVPLKTRANAIAQLPVFVLPTQ